MKVTGSRNILKLFVFEVIPFELLLFGSLRHEFAEKKGGSGISCTGGKMTMIF